LQEDWNKTIEECYTQFGSGRPEILSQDSKDIITSASGIKNSSCRKVTREIFRKTGNPLHVIAKPLKTNTHTEDRKWLAKFVADWTEEDFLHIAPSDEFYIYVVRSEDRQNRYSYDVLQNNIEKTLKDIEDDTDLFIDLLCSMTKRFDALEAAGGGHTNF